MNWRNWGIVKRLVSFMEVEDGLFYINQDVFELATDMFNQASSQYKEVQNVGKEATDMFNRAISQGEAVDELIVKAEERWRQESVTLDRLQSLAVTVQDNQRNAEQFHQKSLALLTEARDLIGERLRAEIEARYNKLTNLIYETCMLADVVVKDKTLADEALAKLRNMIDPIIGVYGDLITTAEAYDISMRDDLRARLEPLIDSIRIGIRKAALDTDRDDGHYLASHLADHNEIVRIMFTSLTTVRKERGKNLNREYFMQALLTAYEQLKATDKRGKLKKPDLLKVRDIALEILRGDTNPLAEGARGYWGKLSNGKHDKALRNDISKLINKGREMGF